MDHIEITNHAAPGPPPPPPPPPRASAMLEMQPPLPLDPPPPDENYQLQMKQEIVNVEYESTLSEGTSSEHQNPGPLNVSENITSPETSEVPICRDFVRGTCTRIGTCKYAHEYDLTQLVGVYTFCRNYQTSVCTFPNCKYVHATVFEEHHFYRTGFLPAHALAHYKKPNVLQPPPPPPPPPLPPPRNYPPNSSVNTTNVLMNLRFPNPPPTLQNELLREDVRNMAPPRSATLKRQWSSIEQVSSSPSDRDGYEPLAKKCKHCDVMELRLQHKKDEVEEMLLAKETLRKETLVLEKKTEKICTIISALLSLPKDTQSAGNSLGSSSFVTDEPPRYT